MAVPDAVAAHISLQTAPAHTRPTYHLLELTPDLVPRFEPKTASRSEEERGGSKRRHDDEDGDAPFGTGQTSLCIKGRHGDEAVLCTDSQTYMIRQVTQSNSMLLCSLAGASSVKKSKADEDAGAVIVRDNVVQILELVPIVARVGRLTTLLSESEYAGEEEEQERLDNVRRYTPQQVASTVQASPAELRNALRQAYIVEMDGYLRMMSRSYLTEALRVLLAHVDRLALSPERVLLRPAVAALSDVHDMRREAAEAMLGEWFGSTRKEGEQEEIVALEAKAIARFLGLQLLEREAQHTPIELSVFMEKWAALVGSSLTGELEMGLLQGDFLSFPAPPTLPSKLTPASVQFFASSKLPLDVSARFQKLFTVRSQWLAEDLTPFLHEVAVDSKRRDALLLKFARSSHVQVPIAETKQERRARLMTGTPHPPTRSVQLYSSRLRY